MSNLTRGQQCVLLALAGILVLSMSFIYWGRVVPARKALELTTVVQNPVASTLAEHQEPDPAPLVVHVTGAVARSGVYHLGEGDRVVDAIDAAGGAAGDADLEAINLAAPVLDGQKIWVPGRDYSAAGGPPAEQTVLAGSGAQININSAGLSELQQLDGIGPALAQRIIDYRENNGLFRRIEDLKQVSGIGDKRYEGLKNKITVY